MSDIERLHHRCEMEDTYKECLKKKYENSRLVYFRKKSNYFLIIIQRKMKFSRVF
jgi:hypothetical protein